MLYSRGCDHFSLFSFFRWSSFVLSPNSFHTNFLQLPRWRSYRFDTTFSLTYPFQRHHFSRDPHHFSTFAPLLCLPQFIRTFWKYANLSNDDCLGYFSHWRTKKGSKVIGPKLYDGNTSRSAAAKVAQLRTGHCRLNHDLCRLGFKDTFLWIRGDSGISTD